MENENNIGGGGSTATLEKNDTATKTDAPAANWPHDDDIRRSASIATLVNRVKVDVSEVEDGISGETEDLNRLFELAKDGQNTFAAISRRLGEMKDVQFRNVPRNSIIVVEGKQFVRQEVIGNARKQWHPVAELEENLIIAERDAMTSIEMTEMIGEGEYTVNTIDGARVVFNP